MKRFALACRLLLGLALLIHACTPPENVTPTPPKGDYYPTRLGGEWTYESTYSSRWDTSSGLHTETALRDTLYEDQNYTYFGLQLVRKENGNYYRRIRTYGFGEEFIFLKDYLPVGGTWTHSSYPGHQAEFTILAIHQEKEVNGVVYRDVIEVEKKDFFTYDANDTRLTRTLRTLYARNVGEIYSRDDTAHEDMGDLENKLVRYQLP
ncbi:MAG: hypothetical protein ICV83_00890 [Cytophagales bacterium]|nr:hypothetical protein [Cytophagales bacterium]